MNEQHSLKRPIVPQRGPRYEELLQAKVFDRLSNQIEDAVLTDWIEDDIAKQISI